MPRPLGSKNKQPSAKAQSLRKRASKDCPSVCGPEPKRIRTEKTLVKDQGKRQECEKTQHCWICHSILQNGEAHHRKPCCPRVYHTKCLKGNKSDLNCDICPECQLETVDGTPLLKPIPPEKLQLLLRDVMNRRRKEESFTNHDVFDHWPKSTEDDVVNVMDFEILDKNIKDSAYSKASEFFSDIKWILHNCFIIYGSISEVTSDAKQLVKSFKVDLLDMEACYECFYYGNSHIKNSFIRVCDPPHDIIWVKMHGYSSWPAKLLKINNGSVYVKFFKTHDIGKDIPISRCHFISKKHPNGECPPRVKPAFDEFKEYVLIYENEYGAYPFHYEDKATPFTPSKASQRVPQGCTSRPNVKGNNVKQPQTSTQQDPFAANTTFSVGQNNPPQNVSEMPKRGFSAIDIQSFTTTKVITSTPIVATPSDIPSDDLTLGADFSNSFHHELNSDSAFGSSSDNPIVNLFNSGPHLFESTRTASASCSSQPGPSTSGSSSIQDLIVKPLVNQVLRSFMSSAVSVNDIQELEALGTLLSSYICMLWNTIKFSPSPTQTIAELLRTIEKLRRHNAILNKDNSELKSQRDDLQRTVAKLQYTVAEGTKKYEQSIQDFHDATNNARKVVHCIQQEGQKICQSKLDAQKKEYELKLSQRDTLIEDCEKHLKKMKSDYDAMKAKYLELNGSLEESPSDSPVKKDTPPNNDLNTNELQEKHVSSSEEAVHISPSREPKGLFRRNLFN